MYIKVKCWPKKGQADTNMYYSVLDIKYAIVLLYVDDLLLVGDSYDELNKIKNILTSKYDMISLDDAKLFLESKLEQIETRIYLHQRSFIEKLQEKINLETYNSICLPMAYGLHLQRHIITPKVDATLYLSLVGSLILVATISIPDISFATNTVCRYM